MFFHYNFPEDEANFPEHLLEKSRNFRYFPSYPSENE